jgi:hypothetical protein
MTQPPESASLRPVFFPAPPPHRHPWRTRCMPYPLWSLLHAPLATYIKPPKPSTPLRPSSTALRQIHATNVARDGGEISTQSTSADWRRKSRGWTRTSNCTGKNGGRSMVFSARIIVFCSRRTWRACTCKRICKVLNAREANPASVVIPRKDKICLNN